MAATDTSQLQAKYRALIEGCGLLDRSERGKLALSGPGAKEFLAGQVTNDVESLSPRSGCYAAFLTPKGKMLGDLRILDLGEELHLDTERVALQALFDMIRRFKIGYDVQLHKRTVERALLSLIGPSAFDVAARAISGPQAATTTHPPARPIDNSTGAALAAIPTAPAVDPPALGDAEHDNTRVEIARVAAVLVRTDVGVDIISDAADREPVREALLSAGAQPVDEAAGEIIRVEHGRPRYGIDLDDTVIPQEAGLNERAVSFTKGCYVGQETVARLFYKGKPNRHLRGLRLSAPAEPGAELRLGERVVGQLTSAVLSPIHGPIGLALVRREAEPGSTVSVSEHDLTAEVIELPFGAGKPPSSCPG